MDKAAKAGPKSVEWCTGSPNMSLIRVSEEREEARYTASAAARFSYEPTKVSSFRYHTLRLMEDTSS